MMATQDRRVSIERASDVAVLRMTRTDAKNAMDTLMLEGLVETLTVLREDDNTKALVIAGDSHVFSAGADIVEDLEGEPALRRMRLFEELYERVVAFPKPTVAAIAGPCIGGGAEVATGCDLRVGTHSARFRFPGALFGIPVGSARLPLLVGMSHAKDLLMTARMIDAAEAYRMGLLNRIVEEEQLMTTAIELAQKMALIPGSMIQKRALDAASHILARTWSENRQLDRWQLGSGRIES